MQKNVLRNKNAELKNANLVQNSYSFISHFLNHSHHSHSLIPHFSGILDHSQSFIPRFLNFRLHFFQCIFHNFKKIWRPSVKLLHAMKPTGNEKKKYTFSFLQSILIMFFVFWTKWSTWCVWMTTRGWWKERT